MDYQSSSTKQQILKLLKMEKRLTAGELAKRLHISEMAVRRHLQALERDGLICSTLFRQAMGRPRNVYELSAKGEEQFPQHYKQWAVELLSDLEALAGKETVALLLQARMARMKERYGHDFQEKPLDEKMQKLLELQNEQGYMAQLKKDGQGVYHFIAHHCPIAEIAKKYRSICSCELQLFQQLLNSKVALQTCITKGDDVCHYTIQETDE
ncbi:MAG: transcriptional regulator [Anoxybacillus sp.]|nr:metalloregulator ArsR/SmtB family transcription factor [Anoxybacillus sp.]MCL6585205.1 transcriptional regulator [Anoxybacillus sp.]